MIGLGLYWGEGYKRGNQELGFTNSDPEILKVFISWLQSNYKVKPGDLIARITINKRFAHLSEPIHEYWSETLRVPRESFTKPSFIKTKIISNSRPEQTYHGTLRLKVRRGTSLRRRILGSISALKSNTVP